MTDAAADHQETGAAEPAVRRITLHDVRAALVKGVDDFHARPTHLPFLALFYTLVALLAARAAGGGAFVALIFPILAGFTLIGPVVALGLYELSRKREHGHAVAWGDMLGVARSPAIKPIVGLGAILLAIFLVWLAAAWAIYALTLGPGAPASPGAFVTAVLTTQAGWSLIVVGNLVGLVFAITVLTISVVSFPMLLDRHCTLRTAVRTSARAVRTSPVPMLVWGAVVAGSLLGGAVPALLGLAFVMPVLGHATWHLYRATVR